MGTIVDDEAFLARVAEIGERSRAVYVEKRRRPAVVFLWLPTDELRVAPLRRRLDNERRAWARVAREAVDEQARGVVFVGDGWAADASGELIESLIVAAATVSGRVRTEIVPLTAIADAAVEPRVTEDLPDFLEVVTAAWAG